MIDKSMRRAHAKARTGCSTCKIRHKKCDEQRPFCQRCLSTGRRCDGYPASSVFIAFEPPSATSRRHSNTSPLIPAPCEEASRHLFPTDIDSGMYLSKSRIHCHTSAAVFSRAISSFPSRSTSVYESESLYTSPPTGHITVNDYHTPYSMLSAYPAAILEQLQPHGGSAMLEFFEFFCLHTAPGFSSYFNSSTWLNLAIMMGSSCPEILCAAAACGAAHRQFAAGISSEAFDCYQQSNTLHKQALAYIGQLARVPKRSNDLSLMIARLLMGVFSCFQDRMTDAVMHIQACIEKIFSKRTDLIYSKQRNYSHRLSPDSFRNQMENLKLEACNRLEKQSNLPEDIFRERNKEVPHMFTNLEQASHLLFLQVDASFLLLESNDLSIQRRRKAQILHVTHIFQWSVTYARTIQMRKDLVLADPHVHHVLNTTRNALYLLMYLVLFQKPQPYISATLSDHSLKDRSDARSSVSDGRQKDLWSSVPHSDDLTVNFARIVGLVESLASTDAEPSVAEFAISFDSAIGPPRERFPQGVMTSAKTRHLVKSLLPPCEEKDELWNMLGIYSIAERFSAIEEYAVINSITNVVRPAVFPRWSSVMYDIGNRRLLLRYCEKVPHRRETLWTEEKWALDL